MIGPLFLWITAAAAVIIGFSQYSLGSEPDLKHPEVHCYLIDMKQEKLDMSIVANPNSTIIVGYKTLANTTVKQTVYGKWTYFNPPACSSDLYCVGFDNITSLLKEDATLEVVQNNFKSTVHLQLNTTSPERHCTTEEEKRVTYCCQGNCKCVLLGGKPERSCHDGYYGECCENPLKPERVRRSTEKGCFSGNPPCKIDCSELYEDPNKAQGEVKAFMAFLKEHWVSISSIMFVLLVAVFVFAVYIYVRYLCRSNHRSSTESTPLSGKNEGDSEKTI